MKKYLFAKSFDQLSQEKLMQMCAELGVDGPTILMPLYEAKDVEEYKKLIAEEIVYLEACAKA